MREPEFIPPSIGKKEYFALETKSEIKHELWWGEMVAMAGAQRNHVVIVSNANIALGNLLADTSCQTGVSDLRVGLDNAENYVYPDVVVWCDDAQWEESASLSTLLTPLVIVEVLSRSTQLRDRREKLNAYCELPSLRDYLMIAPDYVSVDHYSRGNQADAWTRYYYTRRAQTVRLAAFNTQIEVAQFYRRLDVPEGLRSIGSDER